MYLRYGCWLGITAAQARLVPIMGNAVSKGVVWGFGHIDLRHNNCFRHRASLRTLLAWILVWITTELCQISSVLVCIGSYEGFHLSQTASSFFEALKNSFLWRVGANWSIIYSLSPFKINEQDSVGVFALLSHDQNFLGLTKKFRRIDPILFRWGGKQVQNYGNHFS